MRLGTSQTVEPNRIQVSLTRGPDPKLYDLTLTLKTYVPLRWDSITVKQGNMNRAVAKPADSESSFILYAGVPDKEPMVIEP